MSTGPKVLPPKQPINGLQYCASGRSRAEVRDELEKARHRAVEVDRALHRQSVEICRKNWDAKYKGEYPFDPGAAYTSLIPGERLDQDLCNEFFDLHRAIHMLTEELAEPHSRGDRG